MVQADTVIGAIGLITLLQLFGSCYRGFRAHAKSVRNLAGVRDSLQLDLAFQRHRFETLRLVICDDTAQSLEKLSRSGRRLALNILKAMEECFEEIEGLNRAKSIGQKPGVSRSAQSTDRHPPIGSDLTVTRRFTGVESTQTDIERHDIDRTENTTSPANNTEFDGLSEGGNTQWIDRSPERAKMIIDNLKRYNEQLSELLPESLALIAYSGFPTMVLPKVRDQLLLEAISGYDNSHGWDRYLLSCANLRILNLDILQGNDTSSVDIRGLLLSPDVLEGISTQTENIRLPSSSNRTIVKAPAKTWITAKHQGQSCVIEFRSLYTSGSLEEKEESRVRIEKLVALLSQDHGDFFRHFLLRGFYKTSATGTTYGLVYTSGPETIESVSLEQLLANKKGFPHPDLGKRFKLCVALSTALMHLHAAKWLHKGLSTQSVVFEKGANDLVDISSPRLLGFTSSRPDAPGDLSLDNNFEKEINPFFPREYQTGNVLFQRKHDHFSLGVCMLCIGLWTSIQSIVRSFEDKHSSNTSASSWKNFLITLANDSLPYRCGKIFTSVVVRCLEGKSGKEQAPNEMSQTAFFQFIVRDLAACHV